MSVVRCPLEPTTTTDNGQRCYDGDNPKEDIAMLTGRGVCLRIGALALLCACVLSVAGCSMIERRSELDGSVYARQVPAYPGAKFEDSMGGTTSEGIGGREVSKSQSWFYTVSDSVDTVAAFYTEKLPTASKEVDGDSVVFHLKPTNAGPDESVVVTVEPGRLQITEIITPKGAAL